ncbi:hypothetical protein DY000_02034591 [Brassica cretica]|uniref:Uncharacterized protein n=1 Tax=Brassica cretica TaxID=69181 RepID=A0ABQ7DF05_BRACR|nr:hypothetical protein DY000_02034591 [Brassica cretica]
MKKTDYFLLLGIIILLFLSGSVASAPSSTSPAMLLLPRTRRDVSPQFHINHWAGEFDSNG